MQFSFDLNWILTLLLLSIRLAVALFASPFDLMGRVPVQIRLLFVLAIAALLIEAVHPPAIQLPQSNIAFGLLCANEAIVGLVLALGIHAAFAVFDVAGRLVDYQSGLAAAGILNPATHTLEPLFGTLLMLLATLVFFLSNAHHLMLRGLAFSVSAVPPGHGLAGLQLGVLVHHLGLMFSLGMVLAAPVLAGLLLADVGIAVMARTMPQLNVYFLFLPLKVMLGVGLMALSLAYLSPLFMKTYSALFQYWDASFSP